MSKRNLLALGESIDQAFVPMVAGRVNSTAIKLARFGAEFIWHSHEHEDEALYSANQLR